MCILDRKWVICMGLAGLAMTAPERGVDLCGGDVDAVRKGLRQSTESA
jgi:hypothetical protein